MTYNKVLKSIEYIKKIEACLDVDNFLMLVREIKNYYGKEYCCNLRIESLTYAFEEKDYDELENDKKSLIAFIRSLIDSDPLSSQMESIINDVKKGIDSLETGEWMNYVKYIYSAYNGKISFPKNVSDYFSGSRALKFQVCQSIDVDIVKGIIQALRNYANDLLENKTKPSPSIQNIFNPSNSVEVTISITVEDARKKAEEVGLSQKQLDEVNDKIDEIEKLITANETKQKKWSKAGEIFKWVA